MLVLPPNKLVGLSLLVDAQRTASNVLWWREATAQQCSTSLAQQTTIVILMANYAHRPAGLFTSLSECLLWPTKEC